MWPPSLGDHKDYPILYDHTSRLYFCEKLKFHKCCMTYVACEHFCITELSEEHLHIVNKSFLILIHSMYSYH